MSGSKSNWKKRFAAAMPTMPTLAVMMLLAAGTLLAGCFDVEEGVTLQRDLSGKAAFSIKVDMEPMIDLMATMQHSMSGKDGAATPEELAQVRKEFLDKEAAERAGKQGDEAKEKAERQAAIEKSLPAGIKLVSMSVDDKGLNVGGRFEFSFDDVRHLTNIDLKDRTREGEAAAQGPGKNPFEQPFSGLKVVDEGKTLLVTLSGADARKRVEDSMGKDTPIDPAMQKQIDTLLGSARFSFRLDAPFSVVDSNATRREGSILIWEVKASDPKAKLPDVLTARFKK